MQVVAEEVGGARQSATAKVEIFLLLLFLMSCHERASISSGGAFNDGLGGGEPCGHERQPASVRQGGVQGDHQGEYCTRHKSCSGKLLSQDQSFNVYF